MSDRGGLGNNSLGVWYVNCTLRMDRILYRKSVSTKGTVRDYAMIRHVYLSWVPPHNSLMS